jgi:hypothetical protein
MHLTLRSLVLITLGALLLAQRPGEAQPIPPAAPRTAAPAIPAWVHAGLRVEYVGYSAFVKNGRYVDPIEVLLTTRVSAASHTAASAATRDQIVGAQLVDTYDWSCSDDGTRRGTAFQFWVDPSDASGSIRGPEGERFARVTAGRCVDPWNRTWNATLLEYQNAAISVRLSVGYQTTTGLILYTLESYPTEYVIEYYYL